MTQNVVVPQFLVDFLIGLPKSVVHMGSANRVAVAHC